MSLSSASRRSGRARLGWRPAPVVPEGSGRCGCGEQLILYTSGTSRNPGRRILRCRNWKMAGNCNFFLWIPEPANLMDVEQPVAVEDDSICSEGMDSTKSVCNVVDSQKKIKKLKKKVDAEIFKRNLAYGFAVMSWIVTFVYVAVGRT